MRGAGPRGARERGRARAGVRGGDICGVQSVCQSPTGSGFTWALGLWSPHFSVVGVVSVWGLSPGAGSTAPTLRPFHLSPPDSRPPAFCEGQFGHLFFPKRVTRIIQATYSQLIQAELVSDKDRGSSTTSVAQISQGEDKMTKRKKLRTSGEGLCPPKPLKNPRLGDFYGDPQSSMLGCLHHPEEPEGKLGPVPSTQQHGEEPGKAVSSSPDEETGSPCRLLRQPEKEPAPLPPSQNSFGRFVPQFAKSRKTVTRKEEMKDEDRGSGAFSLLFPSGNKPGPCWPGPSSHANGDPVAVAKAQPRRTTSSLPQATSEPSSSLLCVRRAPSPPHNARGLRSLSPPPVPSHSPPRSQRWVAALSVTWHLNLPLCRGGSLSIIYGQVSVSVWQGWRRVWDSALGCVWPPHPPPPSPPLAEGGSVPASCRHSL
ncbi:break repair meiotic recombinase recruitment factor 1 isoform X5 [Homo sapiens]|uniref:break repair meiotic recombinase recruitment factor 1 isoform X5 n=1 Tax=Homo sapiens TaxID=9606 RepID=UPI0023DEF4D1|nr:break repair meiotic recombinase recruitment factor 1 isoform X5 [Homo sapiens]